MSIQCPNTSPIDPSDIRVFFIPKYQRVTESAKLTQNRDARGATDRNATNLPHRSSLFHSAETPP